MKIFEIEFMDGNNHHCICHSIGKNKEEAKQHIKDEYVVNRWISIKLYKG